MKFGTINYCVKEGFSGLFKNRLMSFAAFFTISACIFMVIVSVCIALNINFMMDKFQDSIGITVFANDDLTTDDLVNLERNIKNISYVKSVRYISSTEAMQLMKEKMEADTGASSELWSRLENDPNFSLSRSFEIVLTDSKYGLVAVTSLERLEGVKKVNHAQDIIQKLSGINHIIGIICLLAILVLCAISVVIVMNTIKMTVFVRRKEINIMKFVGATNWFIRWPFIIEGMFIGLIAAIIPTFICWTVYSQVMISFTDRLIGLGIPLGNFQFIPDYQIFLLLLPLCIIIGIGLGAIGSISGVRKHLNV